MGRYAARAEQVGVHAHFFGLQIGSLEQLPNFGGGHFLGGCDDRFVVGLSERQERLLGDVSIGGFQVLRGEQQPLDRILVLLLQFGNEFEHRRRTDCRPHTGSRFFAGKR